jgi:hypothetical protein
MEGTTMEEAKMCPFLALAFFRGVQQVPVIAKENMPLEITCCRENCQWWQGGKCAMQSIAARMDQVGKYLSHMQGDIEMA